MSSITEPRDPGTTWRSLNELEENPEFLRHLSAEFASYCPEEMRKPTRRGFLAYLGASAALAGLAGCRWPREEILPYARRPANRTPGEPVPFATTIELNGFGQPLLATSVDGRPIKIDGNDQHPLIRGKSNAQMQASVLSLYDPDRSKHPVAKEARESDDRRSSPAATRAIANDKNTWAAFTKAANDALAGAKSRNGAGVAILAPVSESLGLAHVRKELAKKYPQVRWFQWSPVTHDNVIAGTKRAFGSSLRPHIHVGKADVIVAIDDDFLVHHPTALKNAREFAARRDPESKNNKNGVCRFYSIDSSLTLTATNADVRIRVRPEEIDATVGALITAVMQEKGGGTALTATARRFAEFQPREEDAAKFAQLAKDIAAANGRSLITVGAQHSPATHAAVAWLNDQLGNAGETVTYTAEPQAERESAADSLKALVGYINDDTVDTLIMLGGNPVYNAPADVKFVDALKKAATTIHLSERDNETSRVCDWHVPMAHYLETWDATRAYDGTICAVQPLIAPLWDGKTNTEIVANLFGLGQRTSYDITRAAMESSLNELGGALRSLQANTEDDTLWNRFLHTGFLASSTAREETSAANEVGWLNDFVANAKAESDDNDFSLVFYPDYAIGCGEFANNGWLQELPDPLTKLTWDNAAVMAPADAKRLGVDQNDMVNIDRGGNTMTLPVFILPGQVAGVISLALGYGRTAGGAVMRGAGFDVNPLRSSNSWDFASGAKVTKAAGDYLLVNTQDHHAIQSEVGLTETQRRIPELVRTQEIEHYKEEPAYGSHVVHLPQLESMWDEREFTGHKWAMAIDLTKCNGCSACITACQAENNIPVVGKQEVEMGREMHWLRIDRYFRGEPDDPEVLHQPVTCHHCELAPCESVCPVAATVHDSEGINVMVYNRCIGTRYCSNNCPYKVRRFNWFYNHYGPYHPRSKAEGTIGESDGDAKIGMLTWSKPGLLPQKHETSVEQMIHNPEVTVRSRGVMEKCTFCYQRIAKAKIHAKNEWVRSDPETRPDHYHIPDGTIITACEQACPTDAIVFGDLADESSRVYKLQHKPRSYAMLAQLNVKPRLKYLTKITNAGKFAKFEPVDTHNGGHGDDHGDSHSSGYEAPIHSEKGPPHPEPDSLTHDDDDSSSDH